jgi:hypothetical protein
MQAGDDAEVDDFNPWLPAEHEERSPGWEIELPSTGYVCEQDGIICGEVVQLPAVCLVSGVTTNLVPFYLPLTTTGPGNGILRIAGVNFLLGGFVMFVVTAAGDLWGTWSLSAVNYVAGLAGMVLGSLLYFFSQSRQVCHVLGFLCRSRRMVWRGGEVVLWMAWAGWSCVVSMNPVYPTWVYLAGAGVVIAGTYWIQRVLLGGLQLRATALPDKRFLVQGFSRSVLDRLRGQV